MRRFLALALVVLFMSQSAAPAVASTQVDVQPIVSMIQSSWIFAVTGQTDRYAKTHWFTPNIPHGPGPRITPNPMTPVFAKRTMVGAPGGHGNVTLILPERVEKRSSSVPQMQRRITHQIMARQLVTRQGQSSVASTTGIRPIWTYETHSLPGVGSAMTNVANGNVVVQANDVDVPERGIDFAFRRTYNSQSTHDAANSDQSVQSNYGDGWTSTFDAHLGYDASANVISVYDINGTRFDYTWNAATNTWTPPVGIYATLTENSNGCGYIWQKTNGSEYTFWKPSLAPSCSGTPQAYWGRLCAISGRNGSNYIVANYSWSDGVGNAGAEPSSVLWSHTDGATMTFTYGLTGGHHELSSIRRPDGSMITYSYNGTTLTGVTRPGNSTYPSVTEAYQYYPGSHQLQVVFSPRDVATNGYDGAYVGFAYDSSNRILTVADYAAVNFAPTNDGTNSMLQTPGNGVPNAGVVEWHFDQFSGWGTGTTNFGDTNGHASGWVYDSLGRVTDTADSPGPGKNSLYHSAVWDSNNNVTSTTDARRNTTNYGYLNGDTIWVQEPQWTTSLGGGQPLVRYAYDSHHNLTAYCDPYLEWTNGAAACTSTTPGATVYEYDTTGGADPNEQFGRLTDTISPMGYHRVIAYDSYGEPTSVTAVQSILQLDGSSRTPAQTFGYDGHGNLTSYTTGNGTWALSYSADNMNRVIQRTDPDGHASYMYYNADGSVSKTETPQQYANHQGSTVSYDADGNAVSSTIWRQTSAGTAAAQVTTTKWYDGEDRLVEVRQPQDANADLYSNAWMTRYLYDLTGLNSNPGVTYNGGAPFYAHGNLFKTQEYLPSAAVAGPITATAATAQSITNNTWVDLKGTAFDALDRPVAKYSMVDANGAASDQLATETMTYDGASMTGTDDTGLLNKYCNAVSQCSTNAYDTVGHLTDVRFTDAGISPERLATFDPDGRLATRTSSHGTEYFQYDNDGREISYQEATGGGVTSPAKFTHEYYADGSLKQLDVASSQLNQNGLFQYSYQADGHVQTQTIEDDALANVGSTSVHLTYYPSGRVKQRTETGPGANPNTGSWQYDPNGMLSQINTQCSGCAAIGPLSYGPDGALLNVGGYTARGELLQPSLGTSPTKTLFANGTSEAFTSNPNASASYTMTWDGRTGAQLSNQTEMTTTNQVTGVDNTTTSTSTFTYDPSGRMINENTDSGGTTTRSFDDENHTIGSGVTNSTIAGTTAGPQSLAAYDWGANGHPLRIGSATAATMPTSVPQNQYETLHWDGDQLIFTSNSAGAVDDIKVGTGGDMTPLDPTFKGLTFYDRGPGGQINYCHNNMGSAGSPNLAPTFGTRQLPGGQCQGSSMPSSFVWSDAPLTVNKNASTHYVGIGQGKLLGMFRADGITDGFNTIQGVRTMDSAAGTWTTPDAYAGNAEDPASQKSYMWNNNNAVAYSDSTGNAPRMGGIQLDTFGHNPQTGLIDNDVDNGVPSVAQLNPQFIDAMNHSRGAGDNGCPEAATTCYNFKIIAQAEANRWLRRIDAVNTKIQLASYSLLHPIAQHVFFQGTRMTGGAMSYTITGTGAQYVAAGAGAGYPFVVDASATLGIVIGDPNAVLSGPSGSISGLDVVTISFNNSGVAISLGPSMGAYSGAVTFAGQTHGDMW